VLYGGWQAASRLDCYKILLECLLDWYTKLHYAGIEGNQILIGHSQSSEATMHLLINIGDQQETTRLPSRQTVK
jgi:hypothetical protein